jgi:hypothetical protein
MEDQHGTSYTKGMSYFFIIGGIEDEAFHM